MIIVNSFSAHRRWIHEGRRWVIRLHSIVEITRLSVKLSIHLWWCLILIIVEVGWDRSWIASLLVECLITHNRRGLDCRTIDVCLTLCLITGNEVRYSAASPATSSRHARTHSASLSTSSRSWSLTCILRNGCNGRIIVSLPWVGRLHHALLMVMRRQHLLH